MSYAISLQSVSQALRHAFQVMPLLLFLALMLVLPVLDIRLVAPACAAEEMPQMPVPRALAPRETESVSVVLHARGVQIYECRAKADQAGAYDWAFVAPEAELSDDRGNRMGLHYAGPTWEATDGSRITGTPRGRAEAPQGNAIPWLLLTAVPAGTKGLMSHVSSVQRVNTAGGLAPRVTCREDNAGATARVPYTADYVFLSEQP